MGLGEFINLGAWFEANAPKSYKIAEVPRYDVEKIRESLYELVEKGTKDLKNRADQTRNFQSQYSSGFGKRAYAGVFG